MSGANDENELTEEQAGKLEAALHELRDELKHLLDQTREATKPVDLGEPIGRLTRIDAIQQQKMTAANRRDYDLRLRQVQQAIQSFATGKFGICRRCEDPIGFKRLEARPESPYCVDCQDEIDRKHGG